MTGGSFDIGDWCWHTRQATPCRVVERLALWGEAAYRVWLPAKDAVLRARAAELAALSSVRPTVEQILHATKAEVPHSVAVSIESFHEPPGGGTLHIDATIAVERDGQKRILIGSGGEMLKRIGTQARLRIEELTGRKVNLKLWVRITPAWRESREQLGELGYKRGGSSSDGEVVIEAELPGESESEDDEEEKQDEENSQ